MYHIDTASWSGAWGHRLLVLLSRKEICVWSSEGLRLCLLYRPYTHKSSNNCHMTLVWMVSEKWRITIQSHSGMDICIYTNTPFVSLSHSWIEHCRVQPTPISETCHNPDHNICSILPTSLSQTQTFPPPVFTQVYMLYAELQWMLVLPLQIFIYITFEAFKP